MRVSDHRRKMSMLGKNMYKTPDAEARAKMRDSHLGLPSPMKGKKFPPSFGEKISSLQRGRKQSADLVEKRICKLRKPIVSSDGREFISSRQVAEFYGIPRPTVLRAVREGTSTRGLRFRYAENQS